MVDRLVFLAHLISIGAMIILTIGFYTYLASNYEHSIKFGIPYLILFMMLPTVPTAVFAYLKRQDGILQLGRFSAKIFVSMVTVIILVSWFTALQYRLSNNILGAMQETPQILVLLFIAGILANWVTGIFIEKALKNYVKGSK